MSDVELVLRIVLRDSWTEGGVELWFEMCREQLGGRTPRQALDDGDVELVANLAVSGRGMTAT